jgi:5-methylcytosine-specific restriction endonuclease McrA
MKLVLRIILFGLCIGFNSNQLASASELTTTPPPVIVTYETLPKDYIQLDVTKDDSFSISIFRSAQSLIRIVQSTRFYSLLNWSAHTRTTNLQIENYKRVGHFGRWINDPNDDTCFNTRAKVLLRDSDQDVGFRDTNHCSVLSGHWNDPYTGQDFVSTGDIQIDHVVPLKNAYMSGAYKWNFKSRCLYANYMGLSYHLMSVNGIENMKKGDKGPEGYMPPNKEHTCDYIKHWLSIKFLWGLRMTPTEAQAIKTQISENHCNIREFRISTAEVLQQNQFAKDHIDLCKDVEPVAPVQPIAH